MNVASVPEAVFTPMSRIGTPIGTPWPTASVLVVVMRTVSVPVRGRVGQGERPAGDGGHRGARGDVRSGDGSPEATVDGKVPVMVAVVEPLSTRLLGFRGSGPGWSARPSR